MNNLTKKLAINLDYRMYGRARNINTAKAKQKQARDRMRFLLAFNL
jgi:hypothetical protein